MTVNYKKDMVVYQIYPRSFLDTNGDGIGDLRGIIKKLDYLADLGVNALWLSPIYVSPDDDNGYDIADYKAIHPQFGTMADFDELVAEGKKRGIGIVMDLVINHTSDEHEWFRRALAGEKEYQDYYIIRDGKNGRVPNNWGNFFAECPWAPFGDSGRYYLHLFSKKQPDLNWHNPAVLEEVKDILRFWLDRGVIGFRCDVINVIYKNTLKNGKPRIALTGMEHYLSTEGCHRILNTLRREVLDQYGAFTVGETVFVDLEGAKALTDPARKELDMVFAFEHMECDQVFLKWFKTRLSPKRLMKCLVKWQTGMDWNSCYFENHDQPRFISRFADAQDFRREASTMMAGLQMTLRGTPYVYEGQEIGMQNGDFADLSEIEDIESHNIYATAKKLGIPKGVRWKMITRTSRDNARTPMQWSSEAHGGFTSGTPWLKVNGNYPDVNVERDMADEQGVRAFWKRMIHLRKTDPVLIDGQFEAVYTGRQVFVYDRVLDGKRYRAFCNMSGKTAKLPRRLVSDRTVLACNYASGHPDTMQPFEFRLICQEEG
ncbi:MAG: alpha-glucosidase [Ruminococcaceae bacterium]|nr:alpha-glucosidase [Oscillospiraceae bacterium]